MRRRILIVLLGLGTIAGFAAGFASLRWHRGHYGWHRRAAFERHVAEICTDAALRARAREAERAP